MAPRSLFALGLAVLVGGAASCEADPTSTSTEDVARLQILLTDAPKDYLAEAWVWIPRVYLVPGEEDPEEGPPFVDLFNDPENPREYDLLTLQDEITADLTDPVEVPAGTYAQLRLVVSRAEVTLKDGYTFNDGDVTRDLFVPSGAQTGIKVMLEEPITMEAGNLVVVLVDFDVDENFVLQGQPDTPAGINDVLFTPFLREVNRDVNGG